MSQKVNNPLSNNIYEISVTNSTQQTDDKRQQWLSSTNNEIDQMSQCNANPTIWQGEEITELEEISGQFESTATTVNLLSQMTRKDQMGMIVDHIVIWCWC